MMKQLIGILSVFLIFHSEAQNSSSLELSEIMKGDDFIGHQPENIAWSNDGKFILYDGNKNRELGITRYAYNIETKDILGVTPEFYQTHFEYQGEQESIFTKNGNLFSFKNGKVNPILINDQRVYNLQHQKNCYFEMNGGLYEMDPANFSIVQLVAFSNKSPETDTKPDHWEEQEHALFKVIRDWEDAKAFSQQQKELFSNTIPVIYTSGKRYSNVQISPDGKMIFYRLDEYPNDPDTEVPHFISKDGYTYSDKARPKVSDNDPNHQLCVYSIEKDTSVLIDLSILSDIRKKPEYYKIYGDSESLFDKDRNIIMHSLQFNDNGDKAVFDVRSYDNKDRWLVLIDLKSLKLTEVEHQHDEAWIGGPGISSWNMVEGTLGWLDNNFVYFQSEETGYSHLYSLDTRNGKRSQLTSGKWEVHEALLSKDHTKFYITSNKTHPGNREFYHLELKSKKLTPILTEKGAVEITLSPDEEKIAVRYSTANTPWDLFMADNKKGATLTRITKSTSTEFDSYNWYDPEVISFAAHDGENVYARVYIPDTDKKNGAAVIFVHGAGYLQNAHNFWSGYHREYMFHNLLRDKGYTVLDIDYRASKGYGRDHRTAIYRHMGGKDLSDQLDGKSYLVKELGIDENRVGIYGGSYGGFITLMALLTEPGEFKCGAALRSVTDWNHYNHEYTSNILNYPTTDSIAYHQSSPINFAENLQNRLIMLHGMVDDNVQFQDVVRMSQKFIELGKKNWELAVFPVEAHGFKRADSWTDEYRRILEMFDEELLEK